MPKRYVCLITSIYTHRRTSIQSDFGAAQAVLVFDLSQEDSFEKAKEWLEDLRKHVEPDIVLAIVGNKADAPSAFDFAIAEAYAESVGAKAHKTSALQGSGVFVEIICRTKLQTRQYRLLTIDV